MNEKDEVCEGCVTNLFLEAPNGGLLTPSLHCGLLQGVLRGEMLKNKKASEAVLTLRDAVSAKSVFVGNSLRGLIRAQLFL